MSRKNSFRLLTGAYGLARSAKMLETGWAKRAFVGSYFLYKRFWEDPYWNLLQHRPELLASGDILDIGANVGYTSCLFAGAMTPESKVYSFEPDPTNFQLLSDVIRRKKLSQKVLAINAAVGASDGCVELWYNKKHSGDHRVVTDHFKNTLSDGAQTCKVSMMSVDSFVEARNLQRISFIKIDVQGYELAVCEGMRQTLARFPGVSVCCEYAPDGLLELGFDPLRLLDFFRANGYGLHVLTRSSIQSVQDNAMVQRIADDAGYMDLLCVKPVLSQGI
jgi:FkbM family methyltransferase